MHERGAVAVIERQMTRIRSLLRSLEERDDGVGVRLDVAMCHPDGLRPGGRPGREHEDRVVSGSTGTGRATRAPGPIGGLSSVITVRPSSKAPGTLRSTRRSAKTAAHRATPALRRTSSRRLVRKRHRDMAELHDSQVGGHPEERVRAQHANPGSRREVERRQLGGQFPRGRAQLRVGVPFAGTRHRHAVRRGLCQQVVTGIRAVLHGRQSPLAKPPRKSPERLMAPRNSRLRDLGGARGQAAWS